VRILALSGSLRAGSHNTAVLRAARDLEIAGADVVLFDGLAQIPPYSEDVEAAGLPHDAVEALRSALGEADAVLIATPEYNGSFPGALKNALDWASRPFATNPLRGKPVAVVSASTGSFGGLWAQADLRRVLGTIGARVVETQVAIPKAHTRVDAAGELVHADTIEQVGGVLEALVAEAAPVPVAV
jgi:chromate reductase